ncbi:TetR/AcrR family transcriptional regulator [Actinophytocola sp.]|uniref:TetR/AcrR family transcriptional regulator n=1 Tax=Actinophytocola sp. TaxID=1872138 RepID=UPI002D29B137|nr:TetR/AcrR family transcriptional regulator [Actinophytocola sp.]HYQ62152.1 TetR/AcrR family transcriptional regulator [Actinophytocola sp.]
MEAEWPRARPAERRRALSQDLIVDTALDLLGKASLDTVSMRRVAQELGTGPASLYAHVSSKEELHELMLDRLLGRLPRPAPDPDIWTEQILEMARAQLAMLTSYPGIARVGLETVIPAGPNALTYGEAVLAILRAGGLPDRVAVFAFDTLSLWCSAFAYELSAVRTGELDRDQIVARGKEIGAYMAARPAQFPNLLGVGDVLSEATADERFEFALDVFLAGLVAAFKPRRRSG